MPPQHTTTTTTTRIIDPRAQRVAVRDQKKADEAAARASSSVSTNSGKPTQAQKQVLPHPTTAAPKDDQGDHQPGSSTAPSSSNTGASDERQGASEAASLAAHGPAEGSAPKYSPAAADEDQRELEDGLDGTGGAVKEEATSKEQLAASMVETGEELTSAGGGGSSSTTVTPPTATEGEQGIKTHDSKQEQLKDKIQKQLQNYHLPAGGQPLTAEDAKTLYNFVGVLEKTNAGATPTTIIAALGSKLGLREETLRWWHETMQGLEKGTMNTVQEAMQSFLARFAAPETQATALTALDGLKRKPTENWTAYLGTYLGALYQLTRTPLKDPLDDAVCGQYLTFMMRGLDPGDRARLFMALKDQGEKDHPTRDGLRRACADLDEMEAVVGPAERSSTKQQHRGGLFGMELDLGLAEETFKGLMEMKLQVEQQKEEISQLKKAQADGQGMRPIFDGDCWGCGQSGHFRRNCPNKSRQGRRPDAGSYPPAPLLALE